MSTMMMGTSQRATWLAGQPKPVERTSSAVLFDYISPAPQVSRRQLDDVYRFRYRIFCEQLRFIDRSRCPGGRERDEHDDRALHFACRDARGKVIGAARLVLGRPFPLESHCPLFAGALRLDGMRAAEVSRLAVERGCTSAERHRRQETVIALYKGMILASKRLGLTHWLAAMERPLYRVLKGLGCQFTAIGPEIDYSGPVTPYIARVDRLWHEQRMTYLY
jgi:N-acyl-L-homoserine lactone synthetase